ncbi:DNA-binding FadR family transcriptional regulator [Caulobacter ginsengisoli]|uniref:DNA-binding FadR family transcriptional regulator n=1 Tax=Caulobacter ginsengisoli TaxID=400775 RepID=A0ABU0IY18_9CAUL|nr:GntR family transcriptional regulator [Caulobacter ginsengisoli]MDQ0466902.1 DNA-binding FadR family transcriptional regulator [Caulobacter ginsengisoli]
MAERRTRRRNGGGAEGEDGVRHLTWSGEAARRTLKTSELVALDIVRDIVNQGLRAGDRLPLEAQMLIQYRVSRSSLREALRLLEVQGLIAIRPGPGSGTVVGKVLPGNFARTMTLYLHMSGVTYDELLNAWMMTEPMLAELAARNPDRARVKAAMEPFLEGADTCHGEMRRIPAGLAFHDVVSDLAGNRVLNLNFQAIGFIVADHILNTAPRDQLEDQIVDDHRAVAEAIMNGKPQLARNLMAAHVEHVVEDFKAYWPRRVGEKVQWR